MGEEREDALVAELVDVEETAFGTDVSFAKVVHAVDDGSTTGTSDAVVVRLAYTSDRRDRWVCLEEIVLGKVCR